MNWREKIDKNLRAYVEEIIAQSFYHKSSYNKASDKGKAQIWIALGILSKQIYELDMKLNYIERALQEIGLKDKDRDIEKIKQDKKEVENLFRSIISGKQIKPKTEQSSNNPINFNNKSRNLNKIKKPLKKTKKTNKK